MGDRTIIGVEILVFPCVFHWSKKMYYSVKKRLLLILEQRLELWPWKTNETQNRQIMTANKSKIVGYDS
jgi:hypothetical protein